MLSLVEYWSTSPWPNGCLWLDSNCQKNYLLTSIPWHYVVMMQRETHVMDVSQQRPNYNFSENGLYKEAHLRCLHPCVVTVLYHAGHEQPGSKYRFIYKVAKSYANGCWHGLRFSVIIVISRERPNDTLLFKYCRRRTESWDGIVGRNRGMESSPSLLWKIVKNSNSAYLGGHLHYFRLIHPS